MSELFRRIHSLLNRRRLERELEEEMAAHRAILAPEDRRNFGNPLLLREQARDAWGWTWLDHLVQDLRFGMRLLFKSPALVSAAVLVLALGIGVNVTGFNLVNVMFFRPLPVRDPYTLVRYSMTSPTSESNLVPYPAVEFYARNANAVLSAVLAEKLTTITVAADAVRDVSAGLVSPNYFPELGAGAAYGRLFDPAVDGLASSPPVVVLGYRYWQNYMAADPRVVGQVIRVNQHPATIIGVLGADFTGLNPEQGDGAAVWLTIPQFISFVPDSKLATSFEVTESGVQMSARLKPGISRRAADAALAPLSDQLARENPGVVSKEFRLLSEPGGYAANLGSKRDSGAIPLLAMFGVLVLLILATACGNLGNLLLGHAANREREMSIRLSLGASRGRIIRQLMTENLLLALLGSSAGLFLSWLLSRRFLLWFGAPDNLRPVIDWHIALFTFVLGLLACLLFGLTPARHAASLFRHKSRARTIFMAAQVAGSCVLLVISALLVRSLREALNTDPGFDYAHLITVDPQLYAHGFNDARAGAYVQQLESRLREVPGVMTVAETWVTPLGHHVSNMRLPTGDVNLHFNRVSPDFFAAMNIPLQRGHVFIRNENDAVVVSESAARALWPGKDPLQQTFTYSKKALPVVGVVGNARVVARRGDDAVLYMPLQQKELSATTVLVRTSAPPESLLAAVAGAARSVDPTLSPQASTMASLFRERIEESEKLAACVSGMGLLALVLAIVGLYGVVSYSVSQRTREIGIRIALGATPSRLVQNLLATFVRPLAIAILAGCALAAALSLVLRHQLYGVSNWDVLSYGAAILLLLVTSALAALLPARRALKVDPAIALRYE
jgi:predicted permease